MLVDTRALTARIRDRGMPNAVIAHAPDGAFDVEALKAEAAAWPGLEGMDLVPDVTATLEAEGVSKFIASWLELKETVETALESSR